MNHEIGSIITEQQWDNAVSRAERSELKKFGQARSRASISNLVGPKFVIEVRANTLCVRDGWRDAIKRTAHVPQGDPE